MRIIGHQKITNFLNKSIEKGLVSHAYLFSGPDQVGKFAVALDFAQKVTKDKLGIEVVSPESIEKKGIKNVRDIKVERVRELIHRLALSSSGNGYKVAIINDADRLNISAQNALLKTLEEPPLRVILILVAKDEKALLPTIRSRCQKIAFQVLTEKELASMCGEIQNREELIFWSIGRPGRLQEMIGDSKNIEEKRKMLLEFESIFSLDISDKFLLAEELSKDSQKTIEKLSIWMLILRSRILFQKKPESIPLGKAFRLMEKIAENLAVLKNTNAGAKLVLENLLLEF